MITKQEAMKIPSMLIKPDDITEDCFYLMMAKKGKIEDAQADKAIKRLEVWGGEVPLYAMQNAIRMVENLENKDCYVCTDAENGIVCRFKAHKFNETQTFTVLDETKLNSFSPTQLAHVAKEMGDWLRDNHYDKIF